MEKENKSTKLSDAVEVDINPDTITLADLLSMANQSGAGTISIRGEIDNGDAQWGLVITCNEESGTMMDALEAAMEDTITKWLLSRAN